VAAGFVDGVAVGVELGGEERAGSRVGGGDEKRVHGQPATPSPSVRRATSGAGSLSSLSGGCWAAAVRRAVMPLS
jgi:hypothetical protein